MANFDFSEEIELCASQNIDWSLIDGRTFLITGATGLVGTYLIKVLLCRNKQKNANINIIAVGRNKEKFIERFGHLNDKNIVFLQHDIQKTLSLRKIDYIISAASNTHPRAYATEPIATEMTNILGCYNLLNLASQNKNCRFILLSSCDIYGAKYDTSKEFLTETDYGYLDCNTLRAGYIEGKRASEALCNAFKEEKDVDFVIARLCRTFGSTMQHSSSLAISQFILNAVKSEDIVLKSKGNQVFSFLYVFDCITALLSIMTKGKSGEAYNISDNNSVISLAELAKICAKIGGTNVKFENQDDLEKKGASTFQDVRLDCTKLKSLGWKAYFSLEEGLERTIFYLKQDFENDKAKK